MKLSKSQARTLFEYRVGVGFLALKTGPRELLTVEVFTQPDGTLTKLTSETVPPPVFPIELQYDEDEKGPAAVYPTRRFVPMLVRDAVKAAIQQYDKLYYQTEDRREKSTARTKALQLRRWLDEVEIEAEQANEYK